MRSPSFQFATLILAALVATATASVEVRAPVAALDLEERVRIYSP